MKQRGFSLVELMIALVLGLIISGAVIQTMISARVTNSLNQAVSQVQEAGRFVMLRLSRDIMEAGRFDQIVSNVDATVDHLVEAAFIQNRPVGLAGDYTSNASLGSSQGTNGANDDLVINLLGKEDCTGNRFGYPADTEFHVVNKYYVANNKLYCTGFDGRVLRGLRSPVVGSRSVILMDNVESFQVQYGVTDLASASQGQAVQYVTASQLSALRAANRQVVAIRIGVMLKSDGAQVANMPVHELAVLNEKPVKTDDAHYFQVFNQTLALRNMKNFVRSLR
ncbi:PilW family protein [Aestuariibacter sp. A3R04]|uniref:PilW family protein n=1 Tax=Aestuariibacter sp. A3R04 TaxID=2841571 RepID=UPI001C099300|nr:PilW family protein [Aestuariibacter sp. A3R04]MBU3021859.1 PilW family protein [Aestuariibacter sp. A3R04]